MAIVVGTVIPIEEVIEWAKTIFEAIILGLFVKFVAKEITLLLNVDIEWTPIISRKLSLNINLTSHLLVVVLNQIKAFIAQDSEHLQQAYQITHFR